MSEIDSESIRRHRYNTRSHSRRQSRNSSNSCCHPAPDNRDCYILEDLIDYTNCEQAPCTGTSTSCKVTIALFVITLLLYLVWLTNEVHMIKLRNIEYGEKIGNNLIQDAVGRPDYALGASGGGIITSKYTPYARKQKSFLGFKFCDDFHGPEMIIRVTSAPGECWAFQGSTATAQIQLLDYIFIDAVSLEHIPAFLSPSGSIDTAPKEFTVWAIDGNGNKSNLGRFTYKGGGGNIQIFPFERTKSRYKIVEFEVLSNHGNPHFTCVYRLRVHGIKEPEKTKNNRKIEVSE